MARGLDKRINSIFEIDNQVRLSEIRGDVGELRRQLASGLAESCLMLHEIHGMDILQDLKPDEHLSRVLSKPDRLAQFLDLERRLLEFTKLDPHAINYIMHSLQAILEANGKSPERWRDDLELLTGLVCGEARKAADQLHPGSLLRRAVVAGGGALIAVLNIIPIPEIPLPPPVSSASSSAGIWLLSEAAGSYLSKFFETDPTRK